MEDGLEVIERKQKQNCCTFRKEVLIKHKTKLGTVQIIVMIQYHRLHQKNVWKRLIYKKKMIN